MTVVFTNDPTEYNVTFYSTSFLSWSGKKLITLASCHSGGADKESVKDCIAFDIASRGAQMVVGWYDDFGYISGPDWLNYYHEYISEGYTIEEAINYASNHIYFQGNVKNTNLCYSSITSLSTNEVVSNSKTVLTKMTESNNILSSENQNIYNRSDANMLIQSYDTDFNEDDYIEDVSDGAYLTNVNTGEITKGYSYIDYKLKMGDFITNSGYTVIVDSNNAIIAINDNTIEKSNLLINYALEDSSFWINEETKNFYLNKALEEFENSELIDDATINFFYDVNSNTKYAYITFYMCEDCLDEITCFEYEM